MNFTYLDASSILSDLLRPAAPESIVPTVPFDLDERWKSFEKQLGQFKTEFARNQVDLVQKLGTLGEKKDEINVIRMMIENVHSDDLKSLLTELIDNYESREGIVALTQQCGEVKGKVEAMRKVLVDTNCERYAKFTCFVCMDLLVDLFFDPCGHVMCETCWHRTQNKTACPGCRTRLTGAKRIFSMT